ncbi:hypothetical protein [Paenibacillus sp. NPDC058177]|uniref:hypothetical protein n=1 Tax=Paenibacillus sp. NPDC058177 TaxID=3346369 RepID=UPI0036DB8138
MSRVGRKLTMVAIWAGIGILIGMQFGGGGTKISDVLPGWDSGTQAVQNIPAAGGAGGVRQQPAPSAGAPQTYVYVPMAVDPATGAYTPLPVRTETGATAQKQNNQPQQEAEEYNSTTLTPEQILVPEGQKPTVDVLADKTAGLLQEASQKGIRWVVSLFSSAE